MARRGQPIFKICDDLGAGEALLARRGQPIGKIREDGVGSAVLAGKRPPLAPLRSPSVYLSAKLAQLLFTRG